MNKKQKQVRFESLLAIGCLSCRLNIATGIFKPTGLRTEIHHQNEDGKHGNPRLGDEFTVPLCVWHHQGKGVPFNEPNKRITVDEMAAKYGPSWPQSGNVFHAAYPRDEQMLSTANSLIQSVGAEYVD